MEEKEFIFKDKKDKIKKSFSNEFGYNFEKKINNKIDYSKKYYFINKEYK